MYLELFRQGSVSHVLSRGKAKRKTYAVMHNLKLSNNLFSHCRLGVNVNDLATAQVSPSAALGSWSLAYLFGHNGPGRHMPDASNSTPVACTELLNEFEIFWPEVQLELDAELERSKMFRQFGCLGAARTVLIGCS